MRIKAFRALRPREDLVAEIACVPYDTVNREEAAALAEGRPHSFLHVTRPEIDLPDGTTAGADVLYAQAADALRAFREQGVLVDDQEESIYVYRQKDGAHVQTGVVACCHVADYDAGHIKKHERTRPDKEDDRTRHVQTLRAHTGPIFLAYRDEPAIDACVAAIQREPPLYDMTAPDGVEHTVWRMPGGETLADAFVSVPAFYVADGHHRAAAAARAARELDDADSSWFLTVLFPADQLNILPYNRAVHDLNGLSEQDFLARVGETFCVTEASGPSPQGRGHVCMYLAGQWRELTWAPDAEVSDPVQALDVSILQDRLLAPLLGIDDPRTNARIEFIGGIRGPEELERLVDSGHAAVAFSMAPVSMQEVMHVSDEDRCMPPKSTWFEPKLRSGLLVHPF